MRNAEGHVLVSQDVAWHSVAGGGCTERMCCGGKALSVTGCGGAGPVGVWFGMAGCAMLGCGRVTYSLVSMNVADKIQSDVVGQRGRHLPSLQRRRQAKQMVRSSQIWSRPCWTVGRRQPCSSCWKNSWRLKVAIVDPHKWMDRWICQREDTEGVRRPWGCSQSRFGVEHSGLQLGAAKPPA